MSNAGSGSCCRMLRVGALATVLAMPRHGLLSEGAQAFVHSSGSSARAAGAAAARTRVFSSSAFAAVPLVRGGSNAHSSTTARRRKLAGFAAGTIAFVQQKSTSALSAAADTAQAEAVTTDASSSSSSSSVPDAKVAALRELLVAAGVDAFVVPTDDPHLSEYSAECYNRREFISGFKGSAGTAVITTAGQALLWTDGRYFLQAEQELGPGWTLMRSGEPGVPTLSAWLAEHTTAGGSVGVDPLVHSATFATELSAALQKKGIALQPLDPTRPNPVDTVWGAARPAAPDAPLRVHPLRYDITIKTFMRRLARPLLAC
jgi:Creatinase/Prolidase N-terminal domain